MAGNNNLDLLIEFIEREKRLPKRKKDKEAQTLNSIKSRQAYKTNPRLKELEVLYQQYDASFTSFEELWNKNKKE